MAKIVLGIGTSHSPLLLLESQKWAFRSADDRRNPALNTLDGRLLSYDQLVAERGEPFVEDSDPAGFEALARAAEAALDRLAATLKAANPDVVMVIGDDQGELFGHDNMPAMSVYRGDEVVMAGMEGRKGPAWADQAFWAGYRMDVPNRYPAAPALGLDLVHGLIRQGVDVASSDRVPDPARRAFGHAFGFVLERLMKDVPVPMLPVLLNTYFPPNTPTAARCHEIGAKIAMALAASRSDARVAVVASGGLSHFLCEEAWDRQLVEAMRTHDVATLTQVPQEALLSGSSEVRNWIMLLGAIPHLSCVQSDYIPVRRTPLGTGIGLGFAAWQ
jgi:hypothetical protein